MYEQVAASVVPVVGSKPDLDSRAIGDELTARHGGFWDVFLLGDSFSYSVYCIEYVELAGEYWTVLICKESVDEWGNDCGDHGLSLYSNGSLAPKALTSIAQGSVGAAVPSGFFKPALEFYKHYQLGDELKAAHTGALVDIITAFRPTEVSPVASPHGRCASCRVAAQQQVVAPRRPQVNSSLADWVRRRAEAIWPADYWNVVIEVSPGAS